MKEKLECAAVPKVNDRACSSGYDVLDPLESVAKAARAEISDEVPLAQSSSYRVSYIPGVPPREEPVELPRLFIEGGSGGSIKMDLSGVGYQLCQSAFAFTMPDESLCDLRIHGGDIAIVEPQGVSPKAGRLVLVLDGATDTLRLVTEKDGVQWLVAADGTDRPPTLFSVCPYQGVVLGIIRLFHEIKPVSYQRKDFQIGSLPEISASMPSFRYRYEQPEEPPRYKPLYCDQDSEPMTEEPSRPKPIYYDQGSEPVAEVAPTVINRVKRRFVGILVRLLCLLCLPREHDEKVS